MSEKNEGIQAVVDTLDAEQRSVVGSAKGRVAIELSVQHGRIRGSLGAAYLAVFALYLMERGSAGRELSADVLTRLKGVVGAFRTYVHAAICEDRGVPLRDTSDGGDRRSNPPGWSSCNQLISTAYKILTSDKGDYTWSDILDAAGLNANGEDREGGHEPGAVDRLARAARGTPSPRSAGSEKDLAEIVAEADPEELIVALTGRDDFEALAVMILDTLAEIEEEESTAAPAEEDADEPKPAAA